MRALQRERSTDRVQRVKVSLVNQELRLREGFLDDGFLWGTFHVLQQRITLWRSDKRVQRARCSPQFPTLARRLARGILSGKTLHWLNGAPVVGVKIYLEEQELKH